MSAKVQKIRIFFISKKQKSRDPLCLYRLSGYQDSNLGPPAPKAGALTGLRYIPFILLFYRTAGAKVIYFFQPTKYYFITEYKIS